MVPLKDLKILIIRCFLLQKKKIPDRKFLLFVSLSKKLGFIMHVIPTKCSSYPKGYLSWLLHFLGDKYILKKSKVIHNLKPFFIFTFVIFLYLLSMSNHSCLFSYYFYKLYQQISIDPMEENSELEEHDEDTIDTI